MPDKQTVDPKDSIPFFPDHVKTEILLMFALLLVAFAIGALGMASPVGTGEPADPLNTPVHVKPEWYFLSLYQLLKFIPKTAGAVIPVILVLLVTVWPFIDRKPDTGSKGRKVRSYLVAASLIVIIALTIWGEVS